MLKAILRSLHTGVVTIQYPAQRAEPPARFRGAPQVRPGSQIDALPPPSVCPSGAITGGPGESRYAIDLARCLFCGRCAKDSPEAAIEIGREFELAARSRERLVIQVERDADGRAAQLPAPPSNEKVAERIRRTLGRSLHEFDVLLYDENA